MRYCQLVIGPAGSGKSTYCSTIVKYCEDAQRVAKVVNLDPAAEYFDYQPIIDIRELIHLDDVMEDTDLHYGPNGGLVFCLTYFIENLDWLSEQLGEENDDYILFDCPGQIELYTHLDVMPKLVSHLHQMEFNICGVFLIDSQFLIEPSKFVSGVMSALSAMVTLEIPHLNVLSKIDLLSKHTRKQLERFLDPDLQLLLQEEEQACKWGKKFSKLNKAICNLLESFSLVKFLPLNIKSHKSIEELLLSIDNAIQYGEDADVKIRYPEEVDDMEEG
ncbi:GPN-loop GTPase 3-like [Uloborus diversus]|uniref:GPN-loop GTPase 3-like n=1 Tax=Uloborus diversus TaxID=327109 RepID=UPI0024096CE9|nr:GPN-loop GTPase 3-like [Uloborus diversus]XP_054718120.1 GPN-loop GTPase 3-like [Uloborus diversus]